MIITNEKAISEKLVEQGRILFDAPKETLIAFTGIPGADALLNDLQTHPHAFVLACLMDRQIAYEKAWLIPYTISQKLGTFSIEALGRQSREDVWALMSSPVPLHRFSEKMSYHSIPQFNASSPAIKAMLHEFGQGHHPARKRFIVCFNSTGQARR